MLSLIFTALKNEALEILNTNLSGYRNPDISKIPTNSESLEVHKF